MLGGWGEAGRGGDIDCTQTKMGTHRLRKTRINPPATAKCDRNKSVYIILNLRIDFSVGCDANFFFKHSLLLRVSCTTHDNSQANSVDIVNEIRHFVSFLISARAFVLHPDSTSNGFEVKLVATFVEAITIR